MQEMRVSRFEARMSSCAWYRASTSEVNTQVPTRNMEAQWAHRSGRVADVGQGPGDIGGQDGRTGHGGHFQGYAVLVQRDRKVPPALSVRVPSTPNRRHCAAEKC